MTSATRPNFHGVLPRLAHLDVIRGAVTGPTADRDSWKAPDTRVVEQVDVRRKYGHLHAAHPARAGRALALRPAARAATAAGNGPGYLGREIDPAGPIQHPTNDGDPWLDTWLYTNPIFVDVSDWSSLEWWADWTYVRHCAETCSTR